MAQQQPTDSLEQLQLQGTDPRLVKQFYRHELDSLVNEKNRQKQVERDRDTQEKKMYNDRLVQLKELEKLKEMSYKNVNSIVRQYYQMLMAGQQQHTDHYVSPFGQRDNVIDSHISVQLTEGQNKARQEEAERNRRMTAMKDEYRQDLLHQIEEKNQLRTQQRASRQQQKHLYDKFAKLPQQIQEFERMRRRQEMNKYREDLDKNRVDRDLQRKRPSESTPHLNNKHNPLVNPMPFNLQNPYILKQLERNNSRNGSYLAGLGSSHLQEPNK